MSDLSNVEVIAIDMIMNNNFITLINALSSNDLSSLHINDSINATTFNNLSDTEKTELHFIINEMCGQSAN